MENKYQEALDYVNKSVCTAMACLGINDKKTREYLHTLQELVNKETPKKVIETTDYGTTRAVNCPICNKRYSMSNSKKYIYCPHCGQHLNWSE